MREATLELLRLYAQQPSEEDMMFASHYLHMAAMLTVKHQKLCYECVSSIENEIIPEGAKFALSSIDCEEMYAYDTSAALIRHLIALRTEAKLPGGFLDDTAYRAKDLASRIHSQIMHPHLEKYRRDCCFDGTLTPQSWTTPKYFVCIQWFVADSTNFDVKFDDDQGIYPLVEAIVLLGTVPPDERERPHLLRLNPVKLDDLLAMHDRIAGLRYDLQESSQHISELEQEFEIVLSQTRTFLNPDNTSNATSDALKEDVHLHCNIETLNLLEDFFDDRYGICTENKQLCSFLREIFYSR